MTGAGCATQVIPPLNPPQPTTIYLCDYGVHSSLLFPAGPHRYIEYLYGDWNWVVLAHDNLFDALGALFFSSQACLGRRYVVQQSGEIVPHPPDDVITVTPLTVGAGGCQAVAAELNRRWEVRRATLSPLHRWSMDYVKDPQRYSLLHNCNGLTAACLREMGCGVKGGAMSSKFDVSKPGG